MNIKNSQRIYEHKEQTENLWTYFLKYSAISFCFKFRFGVSILCNEAANLIKIKTRN